MTEIRFRGHSAVCVGSGDRQLLIDPGVFSDLGDLPGAAAVLVTHEHPDHLAPGVLAGIEAEVWAPSSVIAQLEETGVPATRLHAVRPGDSFSAAGFSVTVHGGQHAEIYPGLPVPANNVYLIEGRILHPGDSFALVPDPSAVEAVLLPIAAPWLRLADAITYARGFPNATVSPIHDAQLSDAGKELTHRILAGVLGSDRYRQSAAGEVLSG